MFHFLQNGAWSSVQCRGNTVNQSLVAISNGHQALVSMRLAPLGNPDVRKGYPYLYLQAPQNNVEGDVMTDKQSFLDASVSFTAFTEWSVAKCTSPIWCEISWLAAATA